MSAILEYKVGGFSHIGRRDYNEDRYCVLGASDNNSVLVVVSDGMGGHEGGALAAQTIIDAVSGAWNDRPADESPEQLLTRLINLSHAAVVAAGQEQGQRPRATFVGLLVFRDHNTVRAISVHAGDSRVMQFSRDGLVTQTIDHSLAQLKVLQGRIRQEDVATDADQNKVLNCIGGEDPPEPELVHWDLQLGDRLVICSDGFWELFNPDDMLALFSAADEAGEDGESLEEIVEQHYLSKLEKTSSQDNTTGVLLAHIKCRNVADRAIIAPAHMLVQQSRTATDTIPPHSATIRSAAEQPRVSVSTLNRRQGILALVAVAVLAVLAFFMFPGDTSETGGNGSGGTGQSQAGTQTGTTDTPSRREPGADTAPPTSPTAPGSPGERGQVTDGAALNTVDQEISVAVTSDQELIDAVSQILRDAGGLGSNDTLVVLREGDIDGNRVVRLSQEHQGVPVFGGELVVVQRGDTLTNLSGATGIDITIDIEPALDFEQAVAQAATAAGQSIRTDGEATLFVYDSAGVFHLAWIGQVVADGTPLRIVLDADDATVLARFPMQIEANQ